MFAMDEDRGHVGEQMKLMKLPRLIQGPFEVSRRKSVFVVFVLFGSRGLGATRLRSGLVWLM